jgi:hypothetical protein
MTKNIRIGERVYWKNMFGIWNHGYVVALGNYCISARLPIDEENYSAADLERTIFLSDSQYITQAAYEQARAKRNQQQLSATC